jgi:hypothetical protein
MIKYNTNNIKNKIAHQVHARDESFIMLNKFTSNFAMFLSQPYPRNILDYKMGFICSLMRRAISLDVK